MSNEIVSQLEATNKRLLARIDDMEERLRVLELACVVNNHRDKTTTGGNESTPGTKMNMGRKKKPVGNEDGFKVGDKVFIKNYKTAYNPFKRKQNTNYEELPGVVVFHTLKFVDVALESNGEVFRKKNNNVKHR